MPATIASRRPRPLLWRPSSELGGTVEEGGLSAQDLRSLATAGFAIGFHTLRHDALPTLSEKALRRALVVGREEIERIAGDVVSISYPHGKANDGVAAAAQAAGYRTGFTTEARAVVPSSSSLLLGRLEPSYGSIGDFAIRLAAHTVLPVPPIRFPKVRALLQARIRSVS